MDNQQLFSFMEPSPVSRGLPRRVQAANAGVDLSAKVAPSNENATELTEQATESTEQAVAAAEQTERAPASASAANDRDALLRTLRAQVEATTAARRGRQACFSTGCQTIDEWLPEKGLHPGALTDWVAAHSSAAAGSLAMLAAANRLRQVPDRPLIVIDCDGTFYPPAAVALGVPAERIILLRPPSGQDAIWAIDHALRSTAVAAVWAALAIRLDDRDARRLQLSAEAGRTPGLLVRGFHARRQPSFSDTQFYVSESRRVSDGMTVTLDRVRGGIVGKRVDLRIGDRADIQTLSSGYEANETAAQSLATRLADPTLAKRARRERSKVAHPRTA
ncbi:MAG: hypothetical protein AAFX06_03540 [Planctomycetota bacterium]